MTRIASPDRITTTVTQPVGKRPPKRRDDSGLTTLEWLLIVAAVAGLAALAVVLVSNVVSDTSEQIAGNSARKTAAQLAATEIMRDAQRAGAQQPDAADTYEEWASFYTDKCNRFNITYSDIPDIEVSPSFTYQVYDGTSAVVAGASTTGVTEATFASWGAATGVAAVANCLIP